MRLATPTRFAILVALLAFVFATHPASAQSPSRPDSSRATPTADQPPARAAANDAIQPSLPSSTTRRSTGAGLGLDIVLPRAATDAWTLDVDSEYEQASKSPANIVRQVLRKAIGIRKPGDIETAVDLDGDQRAEWWVYFRSDRPAFVEHDRFGAGVHDQRIDLTNGEFEVETFADWATSPPLPMAFAEPRLPSVSELFDAAYPAAPEDVPHDQFSAMANQLLPRLANELPAMTARAEKGLPAALREHLKLVPSLEPGFARQHRREGMAAELRGKGLIQLRFVGFDLDADGGKEVAAGFTPWGVAGIQFFGRDWQQAGDLQADVRLYGGRMTHVDYGGRRYLLIGRHWWRLKPESRHAVADVFLSAYAKFFDGRYYEAMAQWRAASRFVTLIGDVFPQGNSPPVDPIWNLAEDHWQFEVGGLPAWPLVRICQLFEKRNELPPLAELARWFHDRHDFDRAIQIRQWEIRLSMREEDTIGQVNAHEHLCLMHRQLGNYDRALEHAFRSLDLESELGYWLGIANNLRYLRRSPENTMEDRRIIATRSHSMALNRSARLACIAELYIELDELPTALGYLEEAERINRPLGGKYIAADLLNLRARLDLAGGEWRLAIDRLTRAIELLDEQIAAQRRDDYGATRFAEGFATHEFRVEDDDGFHLVGMKAPTHPLSYRALTAGLLAEAYLQRYDSDLDPLAHPSSGQDGGDGSDANAAAERDRWLAEADRWQRRSLADYRAANDASGELVAGLRTALIAYRLSRHDEALREITTRLPLAESQRMFEFIWRARALQGRILAAQGKSLEAIAALEAAAEEVEAWRARLHSEPVRRGSFGAKSEIYEQLAQMYFDQGRRELGGGEASAEARISGDAARSVWQCMERGKARTLLDIVAGEPLMLAGEKAAQVRDRAPLLLGPLNGANAVAPIDDLQSAFRQALEQFDGQPGGSMRAEALSFTAVRPSSLDEVQSLLGDNDVLIEYFPTFDSLLVAVIDRQNVEVVSLQRLGHESLRNEVERFRTLLEQSDDAYRDVARRLAAELLLPCLRGRSRVARLHIVPGGALHYLPFAALVLPNDQFLVERVTITSSASASSLVYAVARRHELGEAPANESAPSDVPESTSDAQAASSETSDTLIVANPRPPAGFPPLPHAEQEGHRIAEVTPLPLLLVGESATEEAIRTALPSARFVHFAGHTDLSANSPMRAALLCTETAESDGRLEVRELLEMRLDRCELAVLSACETRMGRMSRGDEVVGLERALLRAGAATVVASLWQVDDAATESLMAAFYDNWLRNGMNKREALRQAQVSMIRGELQGTTDAARRSLGAPRPISAALAGATPAAGDEADTQVGETVGNSVGNVVDNGTGADSPFSVGTTGNGSLAGGAVRHPRFWAAFVLSGDGE